MYYIKKSLLLTIINIKIINTITSFLTSFSKIQDNSSRSASFYCS